MKKFAIIGAGNAGSTITAHLKKQNVVVSLYDVSENQLEPILANDNVVTISGHDDLAGDARIDLGFHFHHELF